MIAGHERKGRAGLRSSRRALLAGRVGAGDGRRHGLGKATALELARCGARVTIAGRRAEVLEQAAVEIAAGARATIDWVGGDVREPRRRERIVASVLERHGRLDVLVNNAGGQFFSPPS